ncbi:MAG TPA: HAMP domain-containing sensor histidine kinase [Ramlibacter sp.]|nr:HAMP domain-containing sensor histidine kinase [Ramlibacter sp.]
MFQPETTRWHGRARHALRSRLPHSLKAKLVALFLLLALAMTGAFLFGMQRALTIGWREAALPLLSDYVDRLAAEIGSPPSIERAQALVRRLPVTVRIAGPKVNWQSHPKAQEGEDGHMEPQFAWHGRSSLLLERTTADGHHIRFGVAIAGWQDPPRRVGWVTLAVLLALTALAYAYVRRLLRPLDDIHAGARRFGAGDFSQPIPVRRRDELGELAAGVNTMARDIHRMLEAKRALLLAISHELRSPLTRARLNTELLPETPELQAQRQALLRDLGEMRDLVTDLLESERLGQGHAALHLEPSDLGALVREAVAAAAQAAQVDIAPDLQALLLDRTRIRLLMRNLLDNALRHSAGAAQPPRVSARPEGHGICLAVRDYGPGVHESALAHLGEAFWRPDAARERATGGVGLGLYLCKLVVQAHGGTFSLRNAQPGLEVRVVLPL